MKKIENRYEKPIMEIIIFNSPDILTTSNTEPWETEDDDFSDWEL